MDAFDTIVLPGKNVVARVAEDLFDIVPEEGVHMVLIDNHGNWWRSHPEEPFGFKGDESLVDDLIVRVDDGDDPAVGNMGDVCVIASQLSGGHMHWGYVLVALPKRSMEATSLNLDLAELVLRQTHLLAGHYEAA